jgi:3-oxoacyl-[acyl-carrier-protein] synthase III
MQIADSQPRIVATTDGPNAAQQSVLGPSGRSRMGSCPGIRVAGTGSYVPDRIVSNEDLAALGCDSEWIVKRTGIRERRKAASAQASSDLAFEAIRSCLDQANVSHSDVDLLICATMTPDFATPSTACILQRRLNCIAPAFDLNAACAGFMYAMVTGAQYVRSGMARNALIVGTEVMSRTVNQDDIKTYPLFGDGAGAILLQPDEPGDKVASGLISYTLGSEGDIGALNIPCGGSREPMTQESLALGRQFLHMDGRSVFVWAVRVVADSINDVLSAANISASNLDCILMHQANIRIVDAAVRSFGISKDKVFVNLDKYGNTSAASIPLALDDAYRQGLIRRGDLVMLCGFGAGLSWGTALVRW